nr:VWA domain-containing protein [Bacillus piscicola]
MSATLAACGNGEEEAASQDEATDDTEAAEADKEKGETEGADDFGIAGSIEEIIEEKPGKYAGNAYNKAVIHRALDEMDVDGKDSFELYGSILPLVNEAAAYKEFYEFAENFNPQMESAISDTPDGLNLGDGEGGTSPANIVILLDASGSMAQVIEGRTKMGLAKDAINDFVASMPEGANVSLRVYGHEGSSDEKDKDISCASTEVVYDLKSYDEKAFDEALGQFEPTGYTPIAKAIEETKKDFADAPDAKDNMVYVVSDGVESCGGDPAKAAKELHDSNIEAVVNIIGFDVDSSGQKELLKVAEAGGGKFETVDSAKDFERVWERERVRLFNQWSSWTAENWNKISREKTKKLNELYGKESDFMNLTFSEESRLKNAVLYLRNNDRIDGEISQEVRSIITQRQDILEEYRDKFDELEETVKEEGDKIKDAIDEKGDDMKDKYGR